jgi:hypothetical protein
LADPASVEEAEERLVVLVEDIMAIQAQLAQGRDGLERREYEIWRGAAVHALSRKTAQVTRTKHWLKLRRIETARIEAGVQRPSNVVELLGEIVRTFKSRVKTPREQALVTLAQRWIETKGACALVTAREQVAS